MSPTSYQTAPPRVPRLPRTRDVAKESRLRDGKCSQVPPPPCPPPPPAGSAFGRRGRGGRGPRGARARRRGCRLLEERICLRKLLALGGEVAFRRRGLGRLEVLEGLLRQGLRSGAAASSRRAAASRGRGRRGDRPRRTAARLAVHEELQRVLQRGA